MVLFEEVYLFQVPIWKILGFLIFQAKKVKFTILQRVLERVFFFTFNHSNTLEENEVHNIKHCKYIDGVKATQS